MDNLSLGDLIRQKRDLKRWSQAQLAEKVGVDTRTILRWESEETSAPHAYALKKLVKELDITHEELDSVNKRGRVNKKAETVPHTVDMADEKDTPISPVKEGTFEKTMSAASMLAETVDPPIQPTHTKRKQPNWLILNLSLITVAIVVTAGIVFWALIGENMFNTISGQVTCPDNQPVAGIWINPLNGGGNYATLQFQNSSASVAKFTYILPNGGGYDVHAGCSVKPAGGWAKTYWTERCSGPIEDRAFHTFTIYDQPPADKSKPCLVRYGQ